MQIKIVVKYDINPNSIEALTTFNDVKRVTYQLNKFHGTNQETCVNQIPLVREKQKITKGDALADGSATDGGELASRSKCFSCIHAVARL